MSVLNRTALAAALLAVAPLATAAGSKTATMPVSIDIENSCTISAESLTFDGSNGVEADVSATADVTVDCTSQGAVAVAFSAGGSGDINQREMSDGAGNTINYNIWAESGHTTLLGDGTTGTTLGGTSTGAADIYTVYGLVPAQGAKPVGNYTDSLTLTLTY